MEPQFATSTLLVLLLLLLFLSAFFSGSETALMRVNRYRLASQAKRGHRGAKLATRLLNKPDKLIGLILLGNNVVNIATTLLAGSIMVNRFGLHEAIVVVILTPIILIFAELAPKTIAALKPESVAYPASFVYVPLLWLAYPFVWVINAIANGLLSLIGVSTEEESLTSLTSEELRVAVKEAGAMLPAARQTMLLRVLDLDSVTVEDIMIPRAEINGIDLDDDWNEIVTQIRLSPHTRLPVFRNEYETVEGVLHLRRVVPELLRDQLTPDALRAAMIPAHYAPEDTALNKQLLNFQNDRHRMALVVDEYGDVQGLITLGDLLAEIVGEFQDDPIGEQPLLRDKGDGVYQVDGAAHVRDLNRALEWNLPTDGPKTLSGLIVELLETIPPPGTRASLHGHEFEVVHVRDNIVKTLNFYDAKPATNLESEQHSALPDKPTVG